MEDDLLLDLDILQDFNSIRKRKVYRERKDPFLEYSDEEFIKLHRFDKVAAKFILELIKDEIRSATKNGGALKVHTKFCAYLRYVAKGFYQEDLGKEYGFSQQSATKVVREVSKALATLRSQFINFPTSCQELTQSKQKFMAKWGFPQVIALIDCTHIKIKKPPGESGESFRNRKGFFSLNCQVLCNADFKILDVVCRWRGSAHDSRIWKESQIKRKLEAADLRGGVVLGDGGYGISKILLTPFRANYPRNRLEDKYQEKHIAVRGDVEKLFGQLKNKFRVCFSGIQVDLNTAKDIIVSICVLHNIAKMQNIKLYDENDFDPVGDSNIDLDWGHNHEISRRESNSIFRTLFIQKYYSYFS